MEVVMMYLVVPETIHKAVNAVITNSSRNCKVVTSVALHSLKLQKCLKWLLEPRHSRAQLFINFLRGSTIRAFLNHAPPLNFSHQFSLPTIVSILWLQANLQISALYDVLFVRYALLKVLVLKNLHDSYEPYGSRNPLVRARLTLHVARSS